MHIFEIDLILLKKQDIKQNYRYGKAWHKQGSLQKFTSKLCSFHVREKSENSQQTKILTQEHSRIIKFRTAYTLS